MTYKTRYLINAVNIFFQIFEKALDEPKYSSMYAQLCHQLCEDAPNFESSSSTISVSTGNFYEWFKLLLEVIQ